MLNSKYQQKSKKFVSTGVDKNVQIGQAFRAEQSRAEQSRAEQSRAEQSRAEQSRAVESNFFEEEEDTKKHQKTADESEKSEPSASFGVFRFFRKNSENKNRNGRLAVVVILAVILLVQSLLVIHYGVKKSGFHIDEIFTFNSSMNKPRNWHHQKKVIDSWHCKNIYRKFMRVNPKNRFNYRIPYVNQESDVHPPLYYMAVHTICSIFHRRFWKWPGLLINFSFSFLSTLLLYFLAKEISGSDSFSLFSAAFWAWSSGAINCAIFLRMYAMLTTWTILLTLLHAHFLKSINDEAPIGKITWAGLFLTTVAGILTQYYFLVFCLFLCGFSFIYLVWKKRYSLSLCYAATEFVALAVSYFIFPAMRKHIFTGYRGKEAFNSFSLNGEWWQYLTKVTNIIYKQLFQWPILPLILSLVLIFSAMGLLSRRKKTALQGKDAVFIFLFLIAVLYLLLISRIAPYRTDRYYFCIYPFFVLPVLYSLYKSGSLVLPKKLLAVIFLGVLALQLGNSLHEQNINYLFEGSKKRQEILSNYAKYPAIIVPEKSRRWTIASYLYEFEKFPVVYGCSTLEGLKNVKKKGGTKYLKHGFLIYAVGYQQGFTDENFIQDVSEYLPISEWKRIEGIAGCPVYFCRTEEK